MPNRITGRTRRLLIALGDGAEASVPTIAERAHMPRATCYLQLSNLAELGLVAFRYESADLTRIVYRITDQGRACLT